MADQPRPKGTGPIQKGETRNPKGRPKKGNALTDLLAAKLDKAAFVERVIRFAMEENAKDAAPYIKLIIEYLDGKPVQPVTQDGTQHITVSYAEFDSTDPT